MENRDVSIMDVVKFADSVRREIYESENLDQMSSTLIGLASGLDVGLTLLEQSVGSFSGLSRSKADLLVKYFMNESKSHRSKDVETSIWYYSYAKALEQLFLDKV